MATLRVAWVLRFYIHILLTYYNLDVKVYKVVAGHVCDSGYV